MRARSSVVGALFLLAALPFTATAVADSGSTRTPSHEAMVHSPSAGLPTQPGQEMFGTVSEIVGLLDASPATDWSRVNIPALRKHLIDMNEVALNARAHITRIRNGMRIRVTGHGRTLDAIHRMLAMHARTMDGRFGWHVSAEPLKEGDLLTVTSDDPVQAARIQGLGFMGIMVYGTHHASHHLAIARGDMAY